MNAAGMRLVVWLVCGLGACGERVHEPAAKPKLQTGFSLDSVPDGASVSVDDRPVGVTPISVTDLSPGPHRVQLELAGYVPWEMRPVLEEGVVIELAQARLLTPAQARPTRCKWSTSTYSAIGFASRVRTTTSSILSIGPADANAGPCVLRLARL